MKTLYVLPTLLLLATVGSPAQAQSQAHNQDRMAEHGRSDQPIDDSWITTKVKSEMLAAKDVPATRISVETVNGVVSLRGTVDNQAQADKAIDVARRIKGVQSVDSTALKVEGQPAR